MMITRINDRTYNSDAVERSIQGIYSPNMLRTAMKFISKYILQKITGKEAYKLLQTWYTCFYFL